MDHAWETREEREREGFVEPAINQAVYVDGLAFAKLRDGIFHIAAYVEQDGPNGRERVINLRFICPMSGVMVAIQALMELVRPLGMLDA